MSFLQISLTEIANTLAVIMTYDNVGTFLLLFFITIYIFSKVIQFERYKCTEVAKYKQTINFHLRNILQDFANDMYNHMHIENSHEYVAKKTLLVEDMYNKLTNFIIQMKYYELYKQGKRNEIYERIENRSAFYAKTFISSVLDNIEISNEDLEYVSNNGAKHYYNYVITYYCFNTENLENDLDLKAKKILWKFYFILNTNFDKSFHYF